MTQVERIEQWNRWYDRLPPDWRFQVVLWPLLAAGAINMVLTIAVRVPFGLLVLLAIICFACVRVPWVAGWVRQEPSPSGETRATLHIGWIWRLNAWYEGLPETTRWWVVPIVLIVAGGVNLILTLAVRFPFGLLFLIALLCVVFCRAIYVWGREAESTEAAAAPLIPYTPSPADQSHTDAPQPGGVPRSELVEPRRDEPPPPAT